MRISVRSSRHRLPDAAWPVPVEGQPVTTTKPLNLFQTQLSPCQRTVRARENSVFGINFRCDVDKMMLVMHKIVDIVRPDGMLIFNIRVDAWFPCLCHDNKKKAYQLCQRKI